ncbi:MAG: hypothetical protein OEW97_07160 [Gammaproteobacteria bacterium]|nr:hypothetical protein [Gammaproteobacteria bacterium]
MAINFKYDSEKEFLVIKISGLLDWDKLRQAAENIATSTEFPKDVDTLYDLTEMDFSNITAEFEQKLIHFRKQLDRGNAKIACLVANDVGFGMGRMYEVLSEDLPQQVRVFRELNEAQMWLLST